MSSPKLPCRVCGRSSKSRHQICPLCRTAFKYGARFMKGKAAELVRTHDDEDAPTRFFDRVRAARDIEALPELPGDHP